LPLGSLLLRCWFGLLSEGVSNDVCHLLFHHSKRAKRYR
jgi:hypothetical protein